MVRWRSGWSRRVRQETSSETRAKVSRIEQGAKTRVETARLTDRDREREREREREI